MRIHNACRFPRGVAAVWAVVVLAILSLLLTGITRQLLTTRQVLRQREQRVQADWLARAGIELAAARLLGDPSTYNGETLEPIPNGRVKIEVRPEKDQSDTFVVTVEARFPADDVKAGRRLLERRFQRKVEKDRVHLIAK